MRQLRFYGARHFASRFLAGAIKRPVVLINTIGHYEKTIRVPVEVKQILFSVEVKYYG